MLPFLAVPSYIIRFIFEKVRMENSLSIVDKYTAKGIATRFFEQHHSDVSAVDANLEDRVWKVTVCIGMINQKIRQVEIDTDTGKIQNCV